MKFSRSFTMSDQVVGVAPRTASPVRRRYVVAAVLALVMMVLAIQYGSDWLLNFLHVMTGALWTGIDLSWVLWSDRCSSGYRSKLAGP
jgi:hypothetical protein